MTRKSPNPISRPDEYRVWLTQVCSVYNRLVPDVKQLILYPAANGDWPRSKPMLAWSDTDAKDSIKNCAQIRSDLSQIVHRVHGAKEPLPGFTQRFITVWDDHNVKFMIQALIQNVKHIVTST